MLDQITSNLPKGPGGKTLLGLAIAVFGCFICMAGSFAVLGTQRSPTTIPPGPTAIVAVGSDTPSPTPTNTPTATPVDSPTPAPSDSPTPAPTGIPTETPTGTLPPTFTPTNTRRPTATHIPTATDTPTQTRTPRPLLANPQNLAVFMKTGSLWVTNRGNNSVVEVDGNNVGRVMFRLEDIPDPNGIAIWQSAGLAYVSNRNQGTVTEIDLINRRVTRTISLVSTKNLPWGLAVDESTGDVFVANFGTGTVDCIQHSTNRVFESTSLPLAAHIAYSPELGDIIGLGRQGTLLRLFCQDNTNFIQLKDNSLFDLAIGTTPRSGTFAYVTATDSKGVYIFGGDTNRFLQLPNAPYGIEYMGGCVGAVVPAEDKVYVMDILLGRAYRTIAVGRQSVGEGGQGIAYNPANDTAYVTNFAANSITAIANPCSS